MPDLVARHPLAWIVSGVPADAEATPLPVQLVLDEGGVPTEVVGHFGRGNPQIASLASRREALVLVMGPQAYVSASWLGDRTQAPTWNYACALFRVLVTIEDDAHAAAERLTGLVSAMEAGRPDGWSLSEMGSRYASLSQGVVGFRARILDRRLVDE